jgi:hypothetical protein
MVLVLSRWFEIQRGENRFDKSDSAFSEGERKRRGGIRERILADVGCPRQHMGKGKERMNRILIRLDHERHAVM